MNLPPQNLDAERAVLGAALLDPLVPSMLTALPVTAYYKEAHRHVARAIQTVLGRGEPVDALTVSAELHATGTFEESGGHTLLATLQESGTVASQVESYIGLIREAATRRGVIRIGREVVEAAADLEVPVRATLHRHLVECVRLDMDDSQGEIVTPADFAAEVRAGKEPPRLETGWHRLDGLLNGGLTCGNLHLLAGRPGNGKTAWALQMTHFVTTMLGLPGLFLSLDMSRSEIGRRYLAHGDLESLARSGFHIADPIAPAAADVVSMIRRAVVQVGIQFAVVDHAGKIKPDRERETNELEARESAVALRNAARALDLPLLVLSQMNRAAEKREGQRPILSDLRASGAWEEEASTVMFLWAKRAKKEDLQDVILTVEKDRFGPTGDVPMTFKRAEGRLLV